MIVTPSNARTYKVGGAVRDALLGITPHDTDWVVVGSDPTAMQQAGFLPVGKDFPVFMHPETREEYALARTERKSGKGYHGFVFHADASVTLEDDLRRRDFTMNAIAEEADGTLIDPFDGVRDIRNRVIRHVSSAFSEDPLRVLRAARFAARFHHLGFAIAAETLELMQQFSQGDELRALSAERVWMEIASALEGRNSHVFFQVLHDTHCLKVILPEVDALFGVPQPEKWHPEIDTGIHVLLCLQQAEKLSPHLAVRFATLVHDVGKAATPAALLPKHHGHETRGLSIIRELCARLRVPNECRELALAVAEFHTHVHKAAELRAETKLKVLERIGAFRKPDALENLLLACEADARGRTGLEDRPYPQAGLFRAAFHAANAITMASIDSSDLEGAAIGKAIHQARIKAIEMTAG